MTILWINLAIVFICAFLARYFSSPVRTTTNSTLLTYRPTPIKPNKLMVFCALVSLVLVSGLRVNIGDTFFYMHIYDTQDFTWEYILAQKDIGFGILQMLLKNISTDSQIMVFTTALITNVLVILVLYKYSRMIELSLYVYITGGMFLVTMNGIRQTLAAAILFAATKFLISGDWKKYMLIVLFASFFHSSALILVPIYFIVRSKAWSKATIILLLVAVLIVIGFDQFTAILFSAIENTQYGEYQNVNEGGANIIRVLVDVFPLAIAFFARDKFRSIFPGSDYIVNMSLIGFVFGIISTQNWIFARFGLYFGFYQLILISWIIKLLREKDGKLLYLGILVCYLIYFFYEHVISLGIQYYSNYLKLQPL